MGNFLTIKLNNNFQLHGDLTLEIPSIDFYTVADSYYYILDDSIYLGEADRTKTLVFSEILSTWKDRLANLKNGQVCFLPFDFSDQYIGCLRMELLDNGLIKGGYGMTQKILGMMINPSQLDQFDIDDSDFELESKFFTERRDAIISSINDDLLRIKSMGKQL